MRTVQGARALDFDSDQFGPGAGLSKPKDEPVHLRGRYAIRSDGAVFANNPVINKMPGFAYSDKLPQHVQRAAQEALSRQTAAEAGQKENALRRVLSDDLVRAEVERQVAERLAHLSVPQTTAEEEWDISKFVIDTADKPALLRFAKERFGQALDGRKSEDSLRATIQLLLGREAQKSQAASEVPLI